MINIARRSPKGGPFTITTVTPYGIRGASSRVRVFGWVDHLGLTAQRHMYMGARDNNPRRLLSDPFRLAAAEYNIRTLGPVDRPLILSKFASPFSRGEVERSVLQSSTWSVYDYDDALMCQGASGLGKLFAKRNAWLSGIVNSDAIIAGNSWLAGQASKHVPLKKVHVIPSCIEPSHYPRKSTYEISQTPRIVWLGSPSTERYLEAISAPLLAIYRKYGARLTLVSSGNTALGALDTITDRVEWDLSTFSLHLTNADIGVMPLPDEPWTRGKCAYKLLQYAATGLPTIASPVGENANALKAISGLAANSEADWYVQLEQLLNASSLSRRALGEASSNGVEAAYSYSAHEADWASIVFPDGRE